MTGAVTEEVALEQTELGAREGTPARGALELAAQEETAAGAALRGTLREEGASVFSDKAPPVPEVSRL